MYNLVKLSIRIYSYEMKEEDEHDPSIHPSLIQADRASFRNIFFTKQPASHSQSKVNAICLRLARLLKKA
jgi:hypothetical protein